MRFGRSILVSFIALELSVVCSHPLRAANLTPWFTMSTNWHRVPTNEVVSRAATGDGEAQCYLGRSYIEGLRGFPTNYAEGRRWLIMSAEQDVAQAQNSLGWNSAHGIGGPTNHAEAIQWFQRAAELGFPQAEVNLARAYRDGVGVPKDMTRVLEYYRRAINHGFIYAKQDLGFILSDDPGFSPAERKEGLQLLREAANEGESAAQNRMGWIHWKGQGVAQDSAEAQRWFFKASRNGSTLAMENLCTLAGERRDLRALTNLIGIVAQYAEQGIAPAQALAGQMYSSGLGVAQDRQKAFGWYRKAAEQDHGPALDWMGGYYYSSGPRQDRKKAFTYYQRAAAMGLRHSKNYMAKLILSGEAGFTNEVLGIKILMEVAEMGSLDAQRDLGARFKEGRGVPTNALLAVHWYSAVMTNTVILGPQHHVGMKLGMMYALGDGVPRNDQEAFKWFAEAAGYNARDAEDSVGYCYAMGRGVSRDDKKAVRWFRAASGVDEPEDKWFFYPALANLGVMYMQGRGGLLQDKAKAVALFERSLSSPSFTKCKVPHAQTALAICLYEGTGIGRDSARALKLFREAASDGNPQAQLHSGVLLWRGEVIQKDPVAAFVYLEAATGNNEPNALAWRDYIAKSLTAAERAEGTAEARSITSVQPQCEGIHGLKAWNLGLRLPNAKIVDAIP